MTKDDIIIAYGYADFLFAEGYDEAILGVDENKWDKENTDNPRIVYSVTKILEILIKRDGMDLDTAREFFDYNIAGGYVGKRTPVWCEDNMREIYNI